jgi:signal transduction histidine kinase
MGDDRAKRQDYRRGVDEDLSLPFLQRLSLRAWTLIDVIIAVVLAASAIALTATDPSHDAPAVGPVALRYVAFVIVAVAVAVRRSRPITALAIAAPVLALLVAVGGRGPTAIIGALVVYSVAASTPRRTSLTAAAAAVAVTWVGALLAHGGPDWASILSIPPLLGVGWLAGENTRRRRAYAQGLAERAAERERERADRALRAAADERVRIARELHDVVAHAMSVVAIRAGVARVVIDTDPEEVREALGIIETTSKRALAEMRMLVGVLREPEDGADLAPAPGLADLPELLTQTRQAGVTVDVRFEGETPQLPAAMDLSAYRIVQEALTNVVRHAGPARAQLFVRYLPDRIEIEVLDDGGTTATRPVPVANAGQGHGLVGMRERVALFGGQLSAAADAGRGFRVLASLPYDRVPQ